MGPACEFRYFASQASTRRTMAGRGVVGAQRQDATDQTCPAGHPSKGPRRRWWSPTGGPETCRDTAAGEDLSDLGCCDRTGLRRMESGGNALARASAQRVPVVPQGWQADGGARLSLEVNGERGFRDRRPPLSFVHATRAAAEILSCPPRDRPPGGPKAGPFPPQRTARRAVPRTPRPISPRTAAAPAAGSRRAGGTRAPRRC